MNNAMTVAELQVVLTAKLNEFQKQLDDAKKRTSEMASKVEEQTNKVKNSFSKIGSVIKTAFSIVAITKFVSALNSWINKSIGAAAASDRLAVTMRNATDASDGQIQAIRDLTQEYEKLGVVSADAQQAGAQELATYVGQADSVRKMLPVLNDMVAQQYGYNATAEEATSIATMLGKVLQGQTGALSRYGYYFDEAQENLLKYGTEEQRVATLAQVVSDSVGGMNMALGATPQGRIVQLRNNFAQLGETIGSLVTNIIQPVIGYLNLIITKLIQIVSTVNAFVQAFFGISNTVSVGTGAIVSGADSASSAVDGIGESADAAKKKLGGLAGFDELNIISSPSSSGSGGSGAATGIAGGGGGLDFGSMTPDTSGVSEFADKVKGIINDLTSWVRDHIAEITSIIGGIAAGFTVFEVIKNWGTISEVLAGISEAFEWVHLCASTFFTEVQAGNGILGGLQAVFGTTTTTALIVAAAVAAIVAALIYLWQTNDEFRTAVINAVNAVMGILNNIWNNVLKPIAAFLMDVFNTIIMPIAKFLASVVVQAINIVSQIVLAIWTNVLAPFVNFLVDILAIAISGVIDIWNAIKPAVEVVISVIQWAWDNVLRPLSNFFAGVLVGAIQGFGYSIQTVFAGVKRVFSGIIDFIVGIFTGNWSRAWNGVVDIFKGIFQGIAGVVKQPINTVIGIINGAIDKINGFGFSVPSWVPIIGGRSFRVNVPKLNYLAEGGIVNKQSLNMLAEGNNPEAVIPLKRDLSAIQQIADLITDHMDGGNNGGTFEINLVLEDGSVLARKVIREIQDYKKVTGLSPI